MTREEALLLLRDFCENPYHLLPIIYEPSARSLIDTFYTQVEQDHEGDPTAAALILSIASTSASFFSSSSTHKIFASTEDADQASAAWRQSALAILDDSQFSTQGSLERCQARAIIAYIVSNVEGCSVRYRYLHSSSMAIARDMSLHLIDSPAMTDKSDDLPTREIKRRLWWHLASTDWLLSLVGGPLDGTYTVQPRHFVVKRPRNLNDSDLSQNETLTYPSHVLTQVSCFLQRIRLSEICREMADSRAPGLLGVDITDFNVVSSLDTLFEKALADMPPSLRRDAPIPQGAPLHLAQQRDLTLLCFNFRRARLHRPFLLHDTDNPLHEASRRQCLASARTVLSISINMLEGPSAICPDKDFGHPLAYRAGLVISAMFTACAILALNAGLMWSRAKGDARTHDASEMHGEINEACRALARAGEKSAFAANLVRNLVGVLKQYSVKDIDYLVAPPTNPSLSSRCCVGGNDGGLYPNAARDRPQLMSDQVNTADDFSMWNEFFTTIPEIEEHEQLFAGLDYYCGPT
ncbi:hypothetical protein F5Y12DRAFT_589262 [Xylaria sp. FL1777]|nr:hypothetical protein F5Y12DRAFT_589262 [Xylaria sp. FL1777]